MDAVWEALRVGTGRAVGDGEAPADRTLPYLVGHVIPGGTLDGSMGDPYEDLAITVQVNAVGGSRDQAQYAQTAARSVILGRVNGEWATPIAGDGWRVIFREYDADGGVDREGTVATAIDRYRLHVTAT